MIKNSFFIKLAAFLFSCLFLVSTLIPRSFAVNEISKGIPFPSVTGATEVYLYNFESNKTIYCKTSENKISPASTVKIMTALLSIKHLENRLDDTVTINYDMLKEVQGYTVGLVAGDQLKVRDLLYSLICGGGNDSAIVLASICFGNVDTFVDEMNSQIKAWGCTDTTFTNPTGIDDPDMKTTLSDVVTLSKQAIETPLYMEMCAVTSYTCAVTNEITGVSSERIFRNRNALISNHSAIGYQNKNVKGLNAGMTDLGGYCVSAYADNGKDSYLCVVMGGSELSNGKISSYTIANTLLNHVFNNYTYTLIAKKGDSIGQVPVRLALPTNGSDAVNVRCVLSNDIYAFAPANINYGKDLTYKTYFYENELNAPICANTKVGGVDIYYGDEYIASGILLTEEDVAASMLLRVIDGMKAVMTSRLSIIFLILCGISISIYFYITTWHKKLIAKIKRIKSK